jgi:hypothetical protein
VPCFRNWPEYFAVQPDAIAHDRYDAKSDAGRSPIIPGERITIDRICLLTVSSDQATNPQSAREHDQWQTTAMHFAHSVGALSIPPGFIDP